MLLGDQIVGDVKPDADRRGHRVGLVGPSQEDRVQRSEREGRDAETRHRPRGLGAVRQRPRVSPPRRVNRVPLHPNAKQVKAARLKPRSEGHDRDVLVTAALQDLGRGWPRVHIDGRRVVLQVLRRLTGQRGRVDLPGLRPHVAHAVEVPANGRAHNEVLDAGWGIPPKPHRDDDGCPPQRPVVPIGRKSLIEGQVHNFREVHRCRDSRSLDRRPIIILPFPQWGLPGGLQGHPRPKLRRQL
mmetsp:Transcript_21693/g.64625  ORF Transcript_21693/g.64625 Transcript_21693/m.64625 type:complete len:242 (-) Transcript_21693:294-1019(-)